MMLLTYQDAAARLAISVSTLRRLVAGGKLTAVRPSPGCVRLLAEEVDRYLQRLSAPVVALPLGRPVPPVTPGHPDRRSARARLGLVS